jgi:hypothetical protein
LDYIPPTTNASEFASWICTERRTGKLGICPEFTLLVLGFNGFAPSSSNNDQKFDNDEMKIIYLQNLVIMQHCQD